MRKNEAMLIRSETIQATLRAAPQQGKRLLPWATPFGRLPFNILEDTTIENEPEVHQHEGDLWYCLEGEALFRYGGTLINKYAKEINGVKSSNEFGGSAIESGTEALLQPGDWLWIPAGVPHQHSAKGIARLVIIKIPMMQTILLCPQNDKKF